MVYSFEVTMNELKELTIDTQLSTSAGEIISSAQNSQTYIGPVVFTNVGSSVELVTVWRLKDGEVATATNYMEKKSIQPGRVWRCESCFGQVIEQGSNIQASTTNSSSVNVNASGYVSN